MLDFSNLLENKMSKIRSLITATIIIAPCASHAITFDFNDLLQQNGNGSYAIGSEYLSSGFSFKGTPSFPSDFSKFYVQQVQSQLWTGSQALTYYGVGALIEFKSKIATPFQAVSIDLSRGDGNTSLIPVLFTGVKSNGSQVTATYWFTDSIKGKNTTFAFGPAFTNLLALNWNQGAEWHQFDNLSISTVPESSSAWYLSLGLAIFAAVTYKRRAA